MAGELLKQLKDVGFKLENPPTSKDTLIKLLKQAGTCLMELDQLSSKSMLESVQPFPNAIVNPEFLKHQDKEIKLLVATCICELTRITAPEVPYTDDVLRDIFSLIVTTFSGLNDTGSPSFGRRVIILETLARYRSCVVMLDLDCDDLVNEMFSTFFSVVSDNHSENVCISMQTIMVVLIEESEDVPEDLVLVLLSVLGRNNKAVSVAARRLSMNVIKNSAVKLEPGIKQFLISSISGDNRAMSSQIDYHEVVYDIYSCAPEILLGVIPYLTGELFANKLENRLKAVRLIGDLFAMPRCTISEAFQPIFSEFLKRLTDRSIKIRISVLEHAKICLLENPLKAEVPQIISAICDRLLDYDASVRKQVVAVICDVSCRVLGSIPIETVKLVAERLRDKTLLVKKYTMERLAEIHQHYCLGVSDGSINPNEFDWIPGKILRCFYDKDFRSDTIESVLCGSLFPAEFSVKDKVEQWVRAFYLFDKVEVKALEKILEQKDKLQQEMLKYLSLRQMHQDSDAPEFQKKVILYFRAISRCFTDPGMAEKNLQILDLLKDSNIWKILTALLDPDTSFHHACRRRDDLLRIVGEKHQLYDFLSALSIKCSYLLFSKEHVKRIILEADRQKSAGCPHLALSSMNLLVIFARFCPLLLIGIEKELVHLLKDDNDVIKEGILHVLAKAGGRMQEQLEASSCSVELELMLERICLEGSRRQAKYAVHALAAITTDDGLKVLSVLYKRLVDMLEGKIHLPAVLQSLGCIAQTAMPIFETRENEIEEFIKSQILERSNKLDDKKVSWDDRSELCSLKIFAIKTLVKSYMPIKDSHLRLGINKLIAILKNTLSFGDISEDVESSLVDKSHLRLASAKAILRLSRCWDHKIPVSVFHLTLRTSEICFPQAKKIFLSKVYQYTKDRLLDGKYISAFLFGMTGSPMRQFEEEEKHNLADIIQMYQQAKSRHLSFQSDVKFEMAYPENILPYIVHALAHHPSFPDVEKCKDIKAFELAYRYLYVFLSMLLCGIEDGKSETGADNNKESISEIISIFQSVKHSRDVVDSNKSMNSYVICELGLLITKHLAGEKYGLQYLTAPISLPPQLYIQHEEKEDANTLVCDVKSWLVDESVLAHLSLDLDASESVCSESINNKISVGCEEYGNEVPLCQILKHLKSQGSKSRKKVKSNSFLVGTKNAINNVDILKMVREINLDNFDISSKFKSTNSHGNIPSKAGVDNKYQKRKSSKACDTMPISIPKRPRSSSSAHPAFKFSLSSSSSKDFRRDSIDVVPQTKTFSLRSLKMEANTCPELGANIGFELGDKPSGQKNISSLTQPDILVPYFGKNQSVSLTGSDSILKEATKAEEIDDNNMKNNGPTEIDKLSNLKCPIVSLKTRKRSVAGLVKCSSKEIGNYTTDLIDSRIKVWWPMDKRFYEGLVKSFDPKNKKHVVLYDDGDVEVLCLEKERWERIIDFHNHSKRFSPSIVPPAKEVNRGKGCPHKNLKLAAHGGKNSDDLFESGSEKNCDLERTSLCRGEGGEVGEDNAGRWRSPEAPSNSDEMEKSSMDHQQDEGASSDNETLGMWRNRTRKLN